MAVYFFDSSGIVKRYVEEKGTPWVLDIADPATGNRIYLARIAGVEVISALTRQKRVAIYRNQRRPLPSLNSAMTLPTSTA